MNQSPDVAAAVQTFFERLSAKDVESFDHLVSAHPATLVIGTAPGEWVTERAQLRFGFEAEGLRVEPRNVVAHADGSLGYATGEATFVFPDGTPMQTRVTMVFHAEDGAWRLVHMHVSVGVPDDEVAELQARWAP